MNPGQGAGKYTQKLQEEKLQKSHRKDMDQGVVENWDFSCNQQVASRTDMVLHFGSSFEFKLFFYLGFKSSHPSFNPLWVPVGCLLCGISEDLPYCSYNGLLCAEGLESERRK